MSEHKELLLPVIMAYENGGLKLVEANGWEIQCGTPEKPRMISVLSNAEWDMELSIICHRQEIGAPVSVMLAVPSFETLFSTTAFLGETSDDDDKPEDMLTDTVNAALEGLQNDFNADNK